MGVVPLVVADQDPWKPHGSYALEQVQCSDYFPRGTRLEVSVSEMGMFQPMKSLPVLPSMKTWGTLLQERSMNLGCLKQQAAEFAESAGHGVGPWGNVEVVPYLRRLHFLLWSIENAQMHSS